MLCCVATAADLLSFGTATVRCESLSHSLPGDARGIPATLASDACSASSRPPGACAVALAPHASEPPPTHASGVQPLAPDRRSGDKALQASHPTGNSPSAREAAGGSRAAPALPAGLATPRWRWSDSSCWWVKERPGRGSHRDERSPPTVSLR